MLKVYLISLCVVYMVSLPNYGYKVAARDIRNEEGRELFDTHQAIIDEGYPAETHRVTTHDGYILEVTRIPHGKNTFGNNASRPVVFMMHGLLAAANSFIILGSNHSIAYHLADAGFDVWMGNARGNYYSRYHVSLDPDHAQQKFEFFDFSFEEIGMYDLAAMIDYSLDQTKRDQLHYIGHSQGGTTFMVLTTMRPEYNEKIKAAHLLAAVGYQEHFPNTQVASLAAMVDTIYNAALLEGLVEYFPIDLTSDEKRRRRLDNCFGDVKYKNMCETWNQMAGIQEIVREDTEADNLLAGASLKQLAHFGQNIRDKSFRRWHYGANKNIEVYGNGNPPTYNLNLISTYVTMHYSMSDNLLDERDVLAMNKDIPKSKVRKVARETFLHEEYVTGKDAKEMVTNHIIEDILEIEAGNFDDWDKVDDIEVNDNDKDENEEIEEENPETIDEDTDDGDESQSNPNIPGSGCGVTLNITFQVYLVIMFVLLRIYVVL